MYGKVPDVVLAEEAPSVDLDALNEKQLEVLGKLIEKAEHAATAAENAGSKEPTKLN